MTGIIICLAIIAFAECFGVYNNISNKHLANELGRIEDILLSERKKFEDRQTEFLKEITTLRYDKQILTQCIAKYHEQYGLIDDVSATGADAKADVAEDRNEE